MNIVNPHLLYLLVILLPLLACLLVLHKRYKKRFGAFADHSFWSFYLKDWSFFYLRLKMVLIIAALAFIILSLVRPQWDRETQDLTRRGLDIAVCIDVSKSMEAKDIAPNRLQRAIDQVSAFIDEQDGNRVALIPFAGTAFVHCPLTDDYDAVKLLLGSLNTNTVPIWGTDIGKALRTAANVFDKNSQNRVVILISDGEDLGEDAVRAARALSRQGIIIYTMGVGTPEGARVSLPIDDNIIWHGQREVITKLDKKMLEEIATVSGGEFYMVTPAQDEIAAVLKHISTLEQSRISVRRHGMYKEQYSLFAIAALLLLLIEILLGARTFKTVTVISSKSVVAGLFLLLFFMSSVALQAIQLPWSKALNNSKGSAAYKKQDYQKAEQIYGKNAAKHSEDEVLRYNHGNALYRLQKGKEATEAWQQALNSKDNKLKSKAWHNLGNQQFQAMDYHNAMESYRQAVLADETNNPARANYDLAKRKLIDKQRQKQKQQPEPQQQKQEQKQQDAERILKALEQKEIYDRKNRQTTPKKMLNDKWW